MDKKATKVFWTSLVGVVLGVSSTVGHAQIYRCTAPDGSTMFADRPCGPDARIHRGTEDFLPSDSAAPDPVPSVNPEPESESESESITPGHSAGTDGEINNPG